MIPFQNADIWIIESIKNAIFSIWSCPKLLIKSLPLHVISYNSHCWLLLSSYAYTKFANNFKYFPKRLYISDFLFQWNLSDWKVNLLLILFQQGFQKWVVIVWWPHWQWIGTWTSVPGYLACWSIYVQGRTWQHWHISQIFALIKVCKANWQM